MAAGEQLRRAAVLGHPIGHSLSPVLHRAAYRALDLPDWRYEAVDVTAEQLPEFMAGLDRSWAGLSLTMPLKQAVLPLLAGMSPLARTLEVVNTVTFAVDGDPFGDNTDVHGIVAALRESGVAQVSSAWVLGGGATAVSAVAALRELGCTRPVVCVRSRARAGAVSDVAARLGMRPEFVGWDRAVESLGAQVVISTVPAGAADSLASSIAEAGPSPAGALLDVVYAPWPTALARAWEERGGTVVSGFEMLVHQAAAQVQLMTGLVAPVVVMRDAGLLELNRPS